MTARDYAAAVLPRIQAVVDGQLPAIEAAGRLVSDAIGGGHRVWVSQTSHTIHTEATHRAGGLMAVHVLEDLSTVGRGDVVIVGTSAGTTAGPVDLALGARERGAAVIALTSVDFERDPRVPSEHPSGLSLHESADVVVDLASPYGDGEFELGDPAVQILPSTGATGVVALWMIFAEAVSLLARDHKAPLVWQSNLLPGGIARNAAVHAEYERTRQGYEPIRRRP